MTEEVERFGAPGLDEDLMGRADGLWVRYSDYKRLEREYDQATQELAIELANARIEANEALAKLEELAEEFERREGKGIKRCTCCGKAASLARKRIAELKGEG